MVEAMRHFKDIDSFKTLTVKCKRDKCPYIEDCQEQTSCLAKPHYKTFSATDSYPQYTNVNKYTKEVWKTLIFAHLCKANYLVNDDFDLPSSLIGQKAIFAKQLEKHINKKCPEVAVLSAFPLYVLDYYGCDKTMQKLQPEDAQI